MHTFRVALSAACLAVASPASADEFFAVTPSGATEALFSAPAPGVIGTLSSKCIDLHWTVTSSSNNEVTCEAPLNLGQSVLGQMLMGNSYSTPPRRFYKFNVAEVNGVSRVQASGWMELQMAFGQMKRTDFSGPEFHNSLTSFLLASGGHLPVGTTFPNHAFLGVNGGLIQKGKYAGLRVDGIQLGSPAEASGIRAGDVIERIARKRFKNDEDYLDATAKAAGTATYEVELIRDGKILTLQLNRTFRPAVAEDIAPNTKGRFADNRLGQNEISSATPISSVADELNKLAKLKNDGVLTDEEFQVQKSRLLSE